MGAVAIAQADSQRYGYPRYPYRYVPDIQDIVVHEKNQREQRHKRVRHDIVGRMGCELFYFDDDDIPHAAIA